MRSRLTCRRGLLFLLALAGISMVNVAGADFPRVFEHQTWRTENGLPQNSVHSIAQTADGYVWLATESGLARFDGLKFAIFDSENTAQLKSNNIRCLQTAGDSLWIGTADGLIRFRRGTFDRFTTGHGLPSNSILSLLNGPGGNLWTTTTEGAARFQNGQFVAAANDSAPGKTISAAAADAQGNLWLGTEAGLSVQAAARRDPPAIPPDLRRANVQALLADRLGRLWIGTDNGLIVYQDGQVKRLPLNDRDEKVRITALFEDRRGDIWVGTEKGSARIVGETVYPVQYPDAIVHKLVLAFLEDREGDIWVGTDTEGATILRQQKFRTFGRQEGIPDDLVRCVFQDPGGTLWAGTNAHGLRRFDGQAFVQITAGTRLSSQVILSLAADAQGNLLAGTPDGLNVIHGADVQLLTSAEGLPDDFVRSIYKDKDGSLWIGTRRGLSHYADGHFRNYSVADGLPSDLVGVVLRSSGGCLWIGTLKGLACLNNGRITHPESLKSTHEPAITALLEDSSGAVWIGTDAGGLIRLAGASAFTFEPALGLPQTISGIAEDTHGRLWISSPRGLFYVSKADLEARAKDKKRAISVVSYGTADGLPVNEFSTGGHPAIWRDRQNAIWFASAKGVVSIDAIHTAGNPVPPPVVFERIVADDRPTDPSAASSFGPGLARISIDYAGLSFAAPQQVRFQYRLEGFDRGWVDAGTRRTAYYTNLAPGAYRFAVRARNGDGVWNMQGAALSFRLLPHFYQTAWFRALLCLAMMALAYLVYRWRVNLVRSEMTAVLAERTRIAREIHDTLAQAFVAVSVQLELVRRVMSTSVEAANEALRQAQATVQDGLAEARRSIWNLRSDAVTDDLPAKLSKFVRQSARDHGLVVQVEVTGAYRPLPATIESEVFRIGQEAVTNVVRHAKATRLDVKLAFDSAKAQMTICDNGQGFQVDGKLNGPDGHFGLRGMRERAEGIEAKLSVTTAAGEGTKVCLEWPFA